MQVREYGSGTGAAQKEPKSVYTNSMRGSEPVTVRKKMNSLETGRKSDRNSSLIVPIGEDVTYSKVMQEHSKRFKNNKSNFLYSSM